ncbi:hypothetical protein [Candidatus Absconditicoccus praedator]|uniref:hypothetical protein n=1 Tax=Candidatus Absconditicoccus praedator TaxID=2735562 RepID=UPI001E61B9A0|nr:hypothetical protein [Candidatus Absconditicoccus praedator]UFX82541.1 hypothetical protein HLG78_00105 [Candidatus Absconditicoccus praedator]
MKQKIIKLLFVLLFSVFMLAGASADMLEDVFDGSKQNQNVANLGNTPDAVGNSLFRGGTTINPTGSRGCFINGQWDNDELDSEEQCESAGGQWGRTATVPPMIVEIGNFLLRIIAVLGITMVLFGGVMLLASMGDESKMKKARNMLFYIALGIILSLSSYALIQLIQSFTVGTL